MSSCLQLETLAALENKSDREQWQALSIAALLAGNGENLAVFDVTPDEVDTEYRALYKAALAKKKFTPLDFLQHMQAGRLSALLNLVVSPSQAGGFVRAWKEEIAADKIRFARKVHAAGIVSGGDINQLGSDLQKKISEIERQYLCGNKTDTLETATNMTLDSIRDGKAVEVLETGVEWFDRLTRGLVPGDSCVLAARPSFGKTALMMQILIELAACGGRSCLFSAEMGREILAQRALAYLSGADVSTAVRFPDRVSADERANILSIRETASYITRNIKTFTGAITWELIAREARKAVAEGCRLIALDYIGLVSGLKGRSRVEEIGQVSRSWKQLCAELRCRGIMLSQINRASESENRKPRLSDLRECGDIEQDADYVWFLHRDKGFTWFLQEKGRNVGQAATKLSFSGKSQTFSELEESKR